MRDFTIRVYRSLLQSALEGGYKILTFRDYMEGAKPPDKTIIMRHDVDRRPQNALSLARVEHEMGVKASYYFRILKSSFHPGVIEAIAAMGHEIGYHYEDLDLARGDYKKAFDSFKGNLARFRELYPVKTIAMHGSPLSAWDNRELWQKYDYHELDISGEPYLDLDFNTIAYFTDTGRRWNGSDVSVRDRVDQYSAQGLKSTFQFITALENNHLQGQILINTHPERWDDALFPWMIQLFWQNTKNLIKRMIVRGKKQ